MKKIEKEVVVDAAPEEVWRAITDGEELKRWFPIDARVKPGVGGAVWFSFGEGSEWESPIEIWEPSRHLRTVDEIPQGEGAPPVRIAVDYFIETRGGKTVVRLVHSGFADSTWDGELDSLNAGWEAFMGNLRHYLERHAGQRRFLAFFRHPAVPVERNEAFRRTLSALGMNAESLAIGKRFDAKSRSGDRFTGEVRVFAPPQAMTATAENWNDAWLMVEIEPGKERCRPAIWLSLYGKAMTEGPKIQERIRGLLEGEFGAAGAER
jgi:uncharacterized protein YndB with AHSA1/START domain